MDDLRTCVVPIPSDVDEEMVDIYEQICVSLKDKDDPDDFMGVITDTMMLLPSLLSLENIMYIIDDRSCRHFEMARISGRYLLKRELSFMDCMMWDHELLTDFYEDKLEWDKDPFEVCATYHLTWYSYQLCYWLREYSGISDKLFREHQQQIKTSVKPPQTVKPTESAKPPQTVKPIESVKPPQAVKPIESVKPPQTVKPTESAKPPQTVKPTESAKPPQTVKPTESAKPPQTVKPIESVKPPQAVKPIESVKPPQTANSP